MATPFDPDAPGLAGPESLFGLPHTTADARVVVIPVPFEATASYGRGTKDAPAAIAQASLQVELNDLDTGEPWRAGIAQEPADPRMAAWETEASRLALPILARGGPQTDADRADCARVDAILEAIHDYVAGRTRHWLDRGRIPAIVGGDHSVSFGAIRAAAERHPGIGLLHIDAHADLRLAYEGFTWSHASILRNVHDRLPGVSSIVSVGLRDVSRAEAELLENTDRITAFSDSEITWELAAGEPWQRLCGRMVRALPEKVWVTCDIDGLDPSLCPNTGTPVPGGLAWREMMLLLHELGERKHHIVGFDLVEVGAQRWDAVVGARLLYKLAGWALSTQPGAQSNEGR